jgi:hypothetical protein
MSVIGCFDNDASDTFANIDMPVGVGKANNRDDVLVVQGLLFIVFTRGSLTTLFDVPKGVTSFTVTGTMDHNTAVLINAFKARVRKRGTHLTPGQFINPVRIRSRLATGRHPLTLVELNNAADLIVAAAFPIPDTTIDVLRRLHPELPNALSIGPITTSP